MKLQTICYIKKNLPSSISIQYIFQIKLYNIELIVLSCRMPHEIHCRKPGVMCSFYFDKLMASETKSFHILSKQFQEISSKLNYKISADLNDFQCNNLKFIMYRLLCINQLQSLSSDLWKIRK